MSVNAVINATAAIPSANWRITIPFVQKTFEVRLYPLILAIIANAKLLPIPKVIKICPVDKFTESFFMNKSSIVKPAIAISISKIPLKLFINYFQKIS